MPRDASGNYTLPAGNPVVTGTTIESTWANPTMNDIAAALTDSLSRNGEGGMLAPFLFADGTESNPSMTFNTEPTTGIYHPGNGDMRVTIQANDVVRFNTANALEISLDGGTTWSTVATIIDAVRTNFDSTILENIVISGTLQDTVTTYAAISTAKAADGFDGLLIGDATLLPILKLVSATSIIVETGGQITHNSRTEFRATAGHLRVTANEAATVDWTATNYAVKSVAGASLTLTFTNPLISASLILRIDASIAVTSITWPVNTYGTPPTTLPAGVNIMSFIYDVTDNLYYVSATPIG